MRSTIKYFLYLTTIVVFIIAWITDNLQNTNIRTLIFVLFGLSFAVALLFNILDRRDERRKRAEREKESRKPPTGEDQKIKHTEGSFSLRDRKSGLTWGGGNIHASEATRGTKRKFLRK